MGHESRLQSVNVSVRRALAFSFIDRNASLLVGIVSSMFLSRLLTPADIGVYSVTYVLLSFVTAFRDFGAGQYLVQERELNEARIRAVWTLQLGIGLALAVLALAASVPVSRFYGDVRIRPIMWLLALSYAINPFGSLTYAWLMRTMRFEALAVMRFSGTLSGALVSVCMAWMGHGPISLAWGNLASIAVNAAVSMFFRPRGFPLLPGLKEVRRVFSFGSRVTSTSIVETVAAGSAELVLGKLQNLAAVGIFSRGNGLVSMFSRLVSESVNAVAMPLFAKAARGESGSVPQTFLRANAYVTVLAWFFAALVMLLAQPLIAVLYGAQWQASVELTRWLAVVMMVAAPASLCHQALMGIGKPGLLLRAVLLASGLSMLGAAVGAYFGLLQLAWGLLVGTFFGTCGWLRITQGVVGFGWREFCAGLTRSAQVAVAAAVPPAAVVWWLGLQPENALLALALGVGGGCISLAVSAVAFRHPMADELLPLWRRVFKGRRETS